MFGKKIISQEEYDQLIDAYMAYQGVKGHLGISMCSSTVVENIEILQGEITDLRRENELLQLQVDKLKSDSKESLVNNNEVCKMLTADIDNLKGYKSFNEKRIQKTNEMLDQLQKMYEQ